MKFHAHWARLALAFSVCLGSITVTQAQSDPVVLTVTAPKAAPPVSASFTMKFLKSLPQRSFVTKTPYYKDAVKFTGPLLRDVLAAAKVKGELMNAIALDDYQIKIPFSDAMDFDVILAHQINGETLTPKNKGPLFIVYPLDSKPELQTVRVYERMVWQLKALRVE